MSISTQPLALICDDEADFYCEALGAAVPGLQFEALAPGPQAADDPRLAECEVLASFAMHLPAQAFSRAGRLRWYQALGAGTDKVMADPARPANVWITSSSGIHGPMLGEMAIFLLLSLAREARALHRQQAEARWERQPGSLLKGKNVVVVGTGASGTEIRRLCAAMGMRVVAASSAPRALPHAERCIGLDALGPTLAEGDFLVLATPFSAATERLINLAMFQAMKPGLGLVNLSRGGIVDEDALLQALDDGTVRAAAMDVFAQEPLPAAHPLWRHPKMIVTPHVAGHVREYAAENLPLLQHNFQAYANGEPAAMRNIVTGPATHSDPA
ncbi:MAG: D-2-hydroxyacid dehydrogenase [Pigmentiphaga sp.]